jgi:hypothetical protein
MGFKKAKYWFVPCLFNEENMEIRCENIVFDIIVDVLVWVDMIFFDDFKIKVYD